MNSPKPVDPVAPADWQALRQFTDARIALGRAGHSLPTAAHLAFQLAHAQARDAVYSAFDSLEMAAALQAEGLQTVLLHSAAPDRRTYIARPDLGRQLDERSRQTLAQLAQHQVPSQRFDVAFVLADGLSPLAVQRHGPPLVAATLKRLQADPQGWTLAPVAIVEQGRVAVGDEVGCALRANAVVVLIGERPGLSSPDSLGVYLSWAPRVGLLDAQRNCISNIRPAGLPVDAASKKLHLLLSQSRVRQLTGVDLKDESDEGVALESAFNPRSFLLLD